jgi:hypothetical protein
MVTCESWSGFSYRGPGLLAWAWCHILGPTALSQSWAVYKQPAKSRNSITIALIMMNFYEPWPELVGLSSLGHCSLGYCGRWAEAPFLGYQPFLG